ncbi:MAG TPA: hypothetical protein VLE99_01880 [Candidatus Saccharimonadales bacterium]|nr:hypothetical protein [Candidatus Saccharimonadales bacterium]
MGVVYSPDALRAGCFPRDETAHATAADLSMETLRGMGEVVVGALAYGSVLGRPDQRSDLDLLVVLSDTVAGSVETYQAVKDRLSDVQTTTGVTPESTIMYAHEIPDRTYGFERDLLFVDYLQGVDTSQNSYRFGRVTDGMVGISQAPEADRALLAWQVLGRTVAQRRGIFSAFTGASQIMDKATYNMLQRATELPSTLGRRLGQCTLIAQGANGRLPTEAYDRERLHARLVEITGGDEAVMRPAAWLGGINREYSEVLKHTILQLSTGAQDVALGRYEGWLRARVRVAAEQSLRLLLAMHAHIHVPNA